MEAKSILIKSNIKLPTAFCHIKLLAVNEGNINAKIKNVSQLEYICYLSAAAASQEGKYSLIVRNHHGTSEAETFITSSRPKSASTDTTTAYAHQKKAPAAVSKAAISLPQLTNATQTTTLSVLSYTLVIKFMSSLGVAVPTRARHSIVL